MEHRHRHGLAVSRLAVADQRGPGRDLVVAGGKLAKRHIDRVEKMTLDEIFPAGQITLNTYRGKNVKRCVATSFTVHSKTKEKDVPGKGKTCKPLILETGHYEIQLVLSKKNYQPVEMRINREQVQTSNVKLEK